MLPKNFCILVRLQAIYQCLCSGLSRILLTDIHVFGRAVEVGVR